MREKKVFKPITWIEKKLGEQYSKNLELRKEKRQLKSQEFDKYAHNVTL